MRLIKWRRFKKDALSTSLVFTIIALGMTAIETGSAPRFSIQSLAPDAAGSKSDKNAIGTISMTLAYLFITLSLLNVSLVWIEIADNAEKLHKSVNHNVKSYRRLLLAYYVIVFGTIAISFAVGNVFVAALVSIPGVLFIIVTYLIGYFKMRRMLMTYLASDAASPGSMGNVASKDTLRKFRESLRAIEYSSLMVSLCSAQFIIWIGIWVSLGGFADFPKKGFNLIAVSIAWFAVSFAIGAVMWYLHGNINRKGKRVEKGSIVIMNDPTSDQPSFQQPSKLKTREKHSQSQDISATSPRAASPSLEVTNQE